MVTIKNHIKYEYTKKMYRFICVIYGISSSIIENSDENDGIPLAASGKKFKWGLVPKL